MTEIETEVEYLEPIDEIKINRTDLINLKIPESCEVNGLWMVYGNDMEYRTFE